MANYKPFPVICSIKPEPVYAVKAYMVFFFKFFRYIHEIFPKKNRIGLGRELKIWKLATTTVLIKVLIEDASLFTIFQREVKINTRFN
jgi:hypothetical protein